MVDDSTLFEQVVVHLLRAKHNVKLDCKYDGETRERQFDGYREVWLDDSLTMLKIGIECKKTRRAVEIGEVEAFSTTIKRCKLDKGIMVSFTGYQSGAIAEAKMSNIGLYSFRPCGAEDLDGRIKQIDYEYIDEGTWSVHLEFETRDINVGGFGSLHETGIYDENGVRIGNLHEAVSGLLEREIFRRGKKAGVFRINWSEKQVYIHSNRKGEKLALRVHFIEVEYELTKSRIKFKPGLRSPDDWYIMEDAIGDAWRLIHTSTINELENMYLGYSNSESGIE